MSRAHERPAPEQTRTAPLPENHRPRTGKKTLSGRLKARRIIAVAVACIAGLSIVFALGYKVVRIDERTVFRTIPYSDSVKAGIDLKTHESETLFTVSLVVIGGLLGLVAAKPDELRVTLADKPEIFMFLGAILLIFSSMICHALYTESVAEVCLRASQDRYFSTASELAPSTKLDAAPSELNPSFIESRITIEDIRDPAIDYLLEGQMTFVVIGLAASACTLLSARFLKEVHD